MKFRVSLNTFRGPLDLLLYLIRKNEVDIWNIPMAEITDQYLEYLSAMEKLDVNAVGEFLEMASTLIEIKSRVVLPMNAEDEDVLLEDPRSELVRQLLEYKKYREAALILDERGEDWANRFARRGSDLSGHERNLAEEPLADVEIWDLVSAFSRIMRANDVLTPSNIVYDETPIRYYIDWVVKRLGESGRLTLSELIAGNESRSKLVSIFLALLELVRHHGIRTEQQSAFGEIEIMPAASPPKIGEEESAASG